MSEFKPFENKEEVIRISKERDELMDRLRNYDIPETEKLFILRKIRNITVKLLEKARYGK